jgi:hypothetical protein
MPQLTQDHIFILPHADEYRRLYSLSIRDVLRCLNTPDLQEGLATDHYTAEKQLKDKYISIYYYLTAPLQATADEVYAIVDFIGYSEAEESIPIRREVNRKHEII